MRSKIKLPQRKTIAGRFPSRPKRSLKTRLALWLLSIIALVSFLLLILPYLPRLGFLINRPKIDPTSYQQEAEATRKGAGLAVDSKKSGNRLILPDIGVDSEIIEGANLWVIGKNQGVWRESRDVTPDKDGNIVIAGHRFLYTARNGGWFYNLPELKTGNRIYIKWDSKTYEYEVYNTRTVEPTQVDIRDKDPKVSRKLTMYTCYPLGSTSKRFVVEAKQI